MARDHADRRISVLGKGGQISNQLSYINDLIYHTHIWSIYKQTVYRSIKGLDKVRIPFFLPPNCGGMGIPLCSDIPKWGIKYINYIYDILAMDTEHRLVELMALKRLTGRVSHSTGFTTVHMAILAKDIAALQFVDTIDDEPLGKVIYPAEAVNEYLNDIGVGDFRVVPYLDTFDYGNLVNAAQSVGLYQISDVFDYYERIVNFQNSLENRTVKSEVRSFAVWARRSSRYWRKYPNMDLRPIDPRFQGFDSLSREINRSLTGFVLIEEMSLLAKYGPSLHFRLGEPTMVGYHTP